MRRIRLPAMMFVLLLLSVPADSARRRPSEEPAPDPFRLRAGLEADTTDVIDTVAVTTIPVTVGWQTLRVPYFGNRPFEGTYTDVTRAILVCHGTLRNANDYYEAVLAAGRAAGGADFHTLIIAPQFLTEPDLDHHELPEDILYWAYMGWRKGDPSLSGDLHPRPWRTSSFAVADTILMRFVERLPNLQMIVVAGHSAGGQFSNLYTAGNRVHQVIMEQRGIPIRYIVSNPSCYIYFDAKRWVPGTAYEYQVPSEQEIADCPGYDDYKYGLLRPNPYMDIGAEALQGQYSSRNVVYLLGGSDTDPESYYLDRSCPAMLQGSQRLERGVVYYNHLIDHFGTGIMNAQTLAIVPGVGHDHYGMFNSPCGKFHLFDYGACVDEPPPAAWEDVSTADMLLARAHSVSWGDYDVDGDPDLFVSVYDGRDKLFRNDAGTWTDASAPPVDDSGRGMSAAWGDMDNDGYPDLYLVNWRGQNRLFRNAAGGTFSDVTAPPVDATGDLCDAAWADYDLDGDLDLYLTRTNGQANSLFRNDAAGGFVDATTPLLENSGDNRGAVWGDYDNDGDPDLYVSASDSNKLFRNDGGGLFADVTYGPLSNPWGGGSSAAWGDFDNDGDLDLYLVNRGQPNVLLRNDGETVFTDVTAPPLDVEAQGHSAAWGDYDNDGLLDIVLANFQGRNRLFRNRGGGEFADVTGGPLGVVGDTFGAAWADYDRDGDLDLFVATTVGSAKLIRNNLPPGGHWLQLDLEGTVSNRSAIGARVRILAGGVQQIREVGGDAGHESQNSATVEFGLGGAGKVDEVEIRWPSGIIQMLGTVAADQRFHTHESELPSEMNAGPLPTAWAQAAPNPFRHSTSIRFGPGGGVVSAIRIFDPAGRLVRDLGSRPERLRAAVPLAWDGRDDQGRPVAPGVYLCRIEAMGGRFGLRLVRLR
jgi:hypothetical protein